MKISFIKIYQYFFQNPHFLLILTMLGWGSHSVVARISVDEVSPMTLIFIRWSLISLLLISIQRKKVIDTITIVKSRFAWFLYMGGICMCLFSALYYIAAHYTTAINLGILQSSLPGIIIVASYVLYKTKINFIQFIGLLFTFAGVILVVSNGSISLLLKLTLNPGDILMVFACICYAMYTVGLRNRPRLDEIVFFTFISIAAWIAAIPLIIIEIITGYFIAPSFIGLACIIYIALVPSLLCQLFYLKAVDRLGPGHAGLYTNLVPIFSAIFAVSFINEILHFYHLLSVLLVFYGIYLFNKKVGSKNSKLIK